MDSLAGQLLVAMPQMSDPRFVRSVIYLCAHGGDTGAMGLVINKLLSAVFATLLICATGYGQSPFFFLYYLILLSAALEIGVGGAIIASVTIGAAYIAALLAGPLPLFEDLLRTMFVWSNLASVVVVGRTSANDPATPTFVAPAPENEEAVSVLV